MDGYITVWWRDGALGSARRPASVLASLFTLHAVAMGSMITLRTSRAEIRGASPKVTIGGAAGVHGRRTAGRKAGAYSALLP